MGFQTIYRDTKILARYKVGDSLSRESPIFLVRHSPGSNSYRLTFYFGSTPNGSFPVASHAKDLVGRHRVCLPMRDPHMVFKKRSIFAKVDACKVGRISWVYLHWLFFLQHSLKLSDIIRFFKRGSIWPLIELRRFNGSCRKIVGRG